MDRHHVGPANVPRAPYIGGQVAAGLIPLDLDEDPASSRVLDEQFAFFDLDRMAARRRSGVRPSVDEGPAFLTRGRVQADQVLVSVENEMPFPGDREDAR